MNVVVYDFNGTGVPKSRMLLIRGLDGLNHVEFSPAMLVLHVTKSLLCKHVIVV
jgi:hypothetical protein